jgi:hypothetical protein
MVLVNAAPAVDPDGIGAPDLVPRRPEDYDIRREMGSLDTQPS